MPLLLRTLRKNKFVRELQPAWVPQDDIQADTLKDLETGDNDLSVWLIEDDLSNLDRVLAALVANRDSLANIDFALIDLKVVANLDISIYFTQGEVLDEQVSRMHCDLSMLTAGKVAKFANAIARYAKLDRRSKSQVRGLLLDSINAGYIDVALLKEGIASKLS